MAPLAALPGAPARRDDRAPDDHPFALVWIDSREAIVARWEANAVHVEKVRSDVPAHRRSTGHVRHEPNVRHGGGGSPQTAGEERRLEHLARFIEEVEGRLPPSAHLILLGPGTVHERLAREVRRHDARHQVEREVRSEVAVRTTHRQLIARLRTEAGDRPRRRSVGAYRWTDRPPPSTPGTRPDMPRRVVAKRSRPTVPRPSDVVT